MLRLYISTMKYNVTYFKNKYRVDSTRLKNWDYTREGYYFVTLCTKNAMPFFGEIIQGKAYLSAVGNTARNFWLEIPLHFKFVEIDEFIIMPNHIHGIVVLNNGSCRDVACYVSTNTNINTNLDTNKKTDKTSQISPKSKSLSAIIRSYKSAVTQWCHQNEKNDFAWQSRFHDHIIRSEKSLFNIRQYIQQNPLKWEFDPENESILNAIETSQRGVSTKDEQNTKGTETCK